MRFGKKGDVKIAQGDMTPMIDMTFQLIAFFMVLINFTDVEQNELIRLPSSVLAKPPDTPPQKPITLQLTDYGTVIVFGEEMAMIDLRRRLGVERAYLKSKDDSPANATIIIRADRSAKTGKVQELIKICQETEFETFHLRAKQEERW